MLEFSLYFSIMISILGGVYKLYKFKEEKFITTGHSGHRPGFVFNAKEFLFNTLFQIKLFKAGKIRWLLHYLLFISFLYLIFIHALHDVCSSALFDYYEPTLDPFQFLRNLAGFLVVTACVGFLCRRLLVRRTNQDKKLKYKGVFSIFLIFLLMGSGFLLEASKIISEPVFLGMVEDYSDLDDETGLGDLKLFWEKKYNLVFAENAGAGPEVQENNRLENGRALNEEYCLSCHSNIKSAFISNELAKVIKNAGKILNQHRLDESFYLLHYLLCLSLLICLPFSRLFHVLLIPFAGSRQNLVNEDFQKNNVFVNQASLYACTNCGYCSSVCSVHPNFQVTLNPDILPHAKIESVKAMQEGFSEKKMWELQSGNNQCTMCGNCTDICPSGIDLQSLWYVLDKKLVHMGYGDNDEFIKNTSLNDWDKKEDGFPLNLADRVEDFENCIQCTICTNVCPIMDYDSDKNDVTPHQVMNLLRLGEKHLATGTRMVWTCLTCYSCQEYCPQGIRVADILLELRNSGGRRADKIKQNSLIMKAGK